MLPFSWLSSSNRLWEGSYTDHAPPHTTSFNFQFVDRKSKTVWPEEGVTNRHTFQILPTSGSGLETLSSISTHLVKSICGFWLVYWTGSLGDSHTFTEGQWIPRENPLEVSFNCDYLTLFPPGVAELIWRPYTMSASMWKATTMDPRHLSEKMPSKLWTQYWSIWSSGSRWPKARATNLACFPVMSCQLRDCHSFICPPTISLLGQCEALFSLHCTFLGTKGLLMLWMASGV